MQGSVLQPETSRVAIFPDTDPAWNKKNEVTYKYIKCTATYIVIEENLHHIPVSYRWIWIQRQYLILMFRHIKKNFCCNVQNWNAVKDFG